MKFIKEYTPYQQEPSTQDVVEFNKCGKILDNKKDEVLAKIKKSNGSDVYYVQTLRGILYDPIGVYSNRSQGQNCTFKKVSKNTFDFYILYLQTHSQIYLTKANRSFINE